MTVIGDISFTGVIKTLNIYCIRAERVILYTPGAAPYVTAGRKWHGTFISVQHWRCFTRESRCHIGGYSTEERPLMVGIERRIAAAIAATTRR